MSGLWPLAAFIVAAFLGLVRRGTAVRSSDAIQRTNYAGRPVPVVLGQVLVSSASMGLLVSLGLALLAGPVPDWRTPLLVWAGAYLLLAIGKLDDRSSHEARGIRAHLQTLVRGRPTTGVWKLIGGIAVAIVLATQMGGGAARAMVAAVVIALSINVTNALDVRPGRALKWTLLTLIPLAAAAWGEGMVLALAAYVGALGSVLGLDLRERAMLGDAGSNPLGLVAGTGLAAVLPLWGLLVALVILVGLQVAAESMTISRLIEAVPPLRWFDRLGSGS